LIPDAPPALDGPARANFPVEFSCVFSCQKQKCRIWLSIDRIRPSSAMRWREWKRAMLLETFDAQPERRARQQEDFFIFFGHNPLKSPDSEK
jgi:hypothetical protein